MLQLLSFILASASALSVGEYKPAGPTDARGPCPMFNTMANHGFLPRDGGLMTKEQVVQVFHDQVAIHPTLTKQLLKGIDDSVTSFNLTDLRKHNVLEHDASLFRNDAYFGDNYHRNQTLLDQFLTYSADGKTITFDEIARYRRDRVAYCKATNPEFSFSKRQQIVAYGEVAVAVLAISPENPTKIPIDRLRAFFGEERLPIAEGWTKRSDTVNEFNTAYLTALLKLKTELFQS